MTTLLGVLLAFWVGAPSDASARRQGQEIPKPDTDKWTVDFKLSLNQVGYEYVFMVEGTTNIPPEILLSARVYAINEVDDFRKGKREDEEPLVWDGDPDAHQPSYMKFKSEGGKFKTEVYRFRRKPYSLRYRARIHYMPHFQEEEIRPKLGDYEFSRSADFTYGTQELFARELEERSKETYEDLLKIDALFQEIKKEFQAQKKKHDKEAWQKWGEGWSARLGEIRERNKERFNLWAVWMERQAKMTLGSLPDFLSNLKRGCDRHFAGAKGALEQVQQSIEDVQGYYEDSIEMIGLNVPLDLSKVGPALAAYEKGMEGIRRWILQGKGEWSKARAEARKACGPAILEITSHLQRRKRAYKVLNDVTFRFTRLIELGDAQAEPAALAKALEEHDAALRAFKDTAGVK